MFKLTEQNRKWWILVAMTSCISMIFIDITVLPVALPTIQRLLGISPLGLQWIINAYTLTLTICVLAAGRFGDRFGYRRIFCWGLLFFSLGSILCGFSNTAWWFISSRVIQGVGGAMLIPNSGTIIFSSFPKEERGKAMGYYVSIGSIFLALGPLVGGVFSEYFNWRLIFWINIPIALIGYFLTLYVVPKNEGKLRPFDLFGFFASALAISCLIVPLMESGEWGWASPWTWGLIIVGFCLFGILLFFDRKVEDPYINFPLFKNRNFSGSILSIVITQFFLMVMVFWAIYFQDIFNYSPVQAGILSLIGNAPVIIAAPIGGHLLDKHGPKIPVTIGFSLVALSLFWFLNHLDHREIWMILITIIPFGCGIPLILTPSFTTAMAEVPLEKRGMASGTATMVRQFGGTLGLAIMSSAFLNMKYSQFLQDLKRNVSTKELNPQQFNGLLSNEPSAISALKKLPEQTQLYVKQGITNAYIDGFWLVNMIGMIAALLGLSLALFLIKKKDQPDIEM